MTRRWVVKRGNDRTAQYAASLTAAGNIVWGLRDEAIRFQDVLSARETAADATKISPKDPARVVRLVRIGAEWKSMREAIEANERAVAAIEAAVLKLAKVLGVQLVEISAQASVESLQSGDPKP